ncbi:MAG: AI-2E family transporter [Candidatus Eisenbacteria bacterium]|nr:AI-2E family transporter [Candidatus Eisenbacteria bacterium]
MSGARPVGVGALRMALAAVAAAAVLWLWRETLSILFLSILLAHVVRPAVDLLARRLPRSLAAASVLGLGLAAAAALAALVLPHLVAQGAQLARDLPGLAQAGLAEARGFKAGLLERIPESWWPELEVQSSKLLTQLGGLAAGTVGRALGTVRQLLGLVVVPVLAFYLAKDARQVGEWLAGWVPVAHRAAYARYSTAADRALTGYVRGQGLVCLVQAVAMTTVLSLMGFPYAFVIGPLAGLAELVPFLGAAVIDVLLVLAGLSRGGWMWAWGLGAYFALNQLLAYLVTPRVLGRALSLHPLALLVALAAGVEVAGFTGMLFALPLTAVLSALLGTWQSERRAAEAAATASPTSAGVAASQAGAGSAPG